MGVIIMELNSSWKLVVLIELQLSCTIYMASCNFATHATCLLKLMAYKYSDLQVSFATQNWVTRPIAEQPSFFIAIFENIVIFKYI
jgi:hypothetical protein